MRHAPRNVVRDLRTSHWLAASSFNEFEAALDLDRDPLNNLIRPRCAERGRGKPVLIMQLAFSLVFTPYLWNPVVSAKLPRYFSCLCSTESVGITHKLPRSL